jgi:micrococcal nuclease
MKEFFNISKIALFIFIIALILVGLAGIYKNPPQENGQSQEITAPQVSKEGERELAKIERIIDGDTFVIVGGRSVRILGINADEKDNLCYEVAKERLEDAIGGQEVTLEVGPKDEDVYGRLLRYVFIGEENISETLVREGLVAAEAPYEGGKYDEVLKSLEDYAKANKLGCKWAN